MESPLKYIFKSKENRVVERPCHFHDPILLAKHKEPELMKALHQLLELVTLSVGV